ncbi:uncharacterized protein LACBIDRAFT_334571 [Laccaria bicolor S238N-H82]|uniref:Predicted protein n=1 Tax=Laccaria bicolor (strain S238N-H82 / ATCC MYA-4686) TaxID=486041 RepID=B0DZI6_LACBS|nr:uncharacterized protein LACBIDRAFT_334571 [Laccaria bicolor S238N-H82]EDQ99980.1 predicted protein [Laccaria bicolor S238N-H82]|eukprot:XP_001889391.1 predicted protein [Laccaria bicolor S238N-H82]
MSCFGWVLIIFLWVLIVFGCGAIVVGLLAHVVVIVDVSSPVCIVAFLRHVDICGDVALAPMTGHSPSFPCSFCLACCFGDVAESGGDGREWWWLQDVGGVQWNPVDSDWTLSPLYWGWTQKSGLQSMDWALCKPIWPSNWGTGIHRSPLESTGIHMDYVGEAVTVCSGGPHACTNYFPAVISAVPSVFTIITCNQLSPCPLSVSPCFTHTTAVNRQLPILDGLVLTTCPQNTCQTTHNMHPSSFHLSSNSSSDESHTYIPQKMSSTASVESTSGKAPVLTGRDVTPAVIMEFENTCHDFFEAKSVLVDKQVTFILPSIKDFCIRNWIAADRATIVALPFTLFMSQLCKNSLHPDWEDHVCDEILKSRLEPNKESFWAWSQNIIKLNCLLRDTTSLVDDATLCNQLDAHLNDDLKDHVKHSKAKKEKTLKLWVDTVRCLDETCISENKRHHNLIEESLNQCFPHGKDYKTLTTAHTLAALAANNTKKGKSGATATTSLKSAPKAVAATAPSSDENGLIPG